MSTFIQIPLQQAVYQIPSDTNRLSFRRFETSDALFMYKLNADNDVLKYTGDRAFEHPEAARKFLNDYHSYEEFGFGRWAVINKSDAQVLGWCGLSVNEENLVDIGFRFFKNHWGKGYATESAGSCLHHGFSTLGIKQIVGRVARENLASIRVLEKLGMSYWKDGPCGHIDLAMYYCIDASTYANQV